MFAWRSKLFADIQLQVKDNTYDVSNVSDDEAVQPEETTFSAHRAILSARCPYFAALLLTPYSDTGSQLFSLPGPPFTPAALHFVLAYIYTGSLSLKRTFDLTVAMQIWRSAVYLNLEYLKDEVECRMADMCHGFSACCKSCRIRATKVFAFSHEPDVNSNKLRNLSRPIIVDYFGEICNRTIGELSYDVQKELVVDLCSSTTAMSAARTMKAICQIRQNIETERATWADHLRSMLLPLEDRIRYLLKTYLGEIAVSQSFLDLLEGVGFSSDVLEHLFSMLVEGLTEKTAARTYEALVGRVLLREDGIRIDARAKVEDARQSILGYLKKRLMDVRSNDGFDNLDQWCLKELSDGMLSMGGLIRAIVLIMLSLARIGDTS